MDKELMERFAKENDYGDWPFGQYPSSIYDKILGVFDDYLGYDSSGLNTHRYQFVCTRAEYENYTQQRNEGSSTNTVTEAFQLLQCLAEQSNYDINITSVGTIISDDAGDEIRGTPEQLYKILEAQINLRNLVKEVTGE